MPSFGPDTRPRQMAEIIAKQPTREARASMLMQVPGEYQAMVRDHVETIFRARARERAKPSQTGGGADPC